MTPNTDTPLTDAEGTALVTSDFARNLERKLTAWRECADSLAKAMTLERAHLLQTNNGKTHWPGCEREHKTCAALLRLETALETFNKLQNES